MSSLAQPKKITITSSNDKTYHFLLKYESGGVDLRKESRFIDFANFVNIILENDPSTKKRNLQLTTYSITPLSKVSGIIEWLDNTTTIKTVVTKLWKEKSVRATTTDIMKKFNIDIQRVRNCISSNWDEVNKMSKSVLWSYFENTFPYADENLNARVKFITSYSLWCIVGYVIGLGDRHLDNIIIHTQTGECSHVDFECIFEKGLYLPVKEIVPFRLTRNIRDVFGVLREDGLFFKTCELVLKALCKNKENILGFFSMFTKDPISVRVGKKIFKPEDILSVIEKKLSTEGKSSDFNGKNDYYYEKTYDLINNAIHPSNLKEMYYGWMPWQ